MTFYTPRNISPADQVLFDANGNAVGIQAAGSSSQPVLGMTPAKAAAVDSLVSGDGIVGGAHPRYFCHLFAGNQLATDPLFYDLSGAQGHAVPGVDSSVAELWANAGYASTLDPAVTVGQRLRAMTLPALNWDYAGGESLMLWWFGKASPEAAATNLIGSYDATATQSGLRVRVATDGKMSAALYDGPTGTLRTFSTSAATAFDGTPHTVGLFLDGKTFKGYSYVDEVVQSNGANILSVNTLPPAAQVAGGFDRLRLGADTGTSGAADRGLASQTRSLVILKFAATDTLPTAEQVRQAMMQLRAAPHRPILRGAL